MGSATDSDAGRVNAAAAAEANRQTMRAPAVGAAAEANEATRNPAQAHSSTLRRPNRSARRPPTSRNDARPIP